MGLIGCPETSVTCCQSALRKMPEERRSHFHGSGKLKSRISVSWFESRSPRNEVTFMVVLGGCCTTLVGFLQCRHNIHGSSATNPSYCPEGVLPKVKTAGERMRHAGAQCQNRWCMALCHDSGCSALSLSVLCAAIVLIGLWICKVFTEVLFVTERRDWATKLQVDLTWSEKGRSIFFAKFVTDVWVCPTV